MVADALRPTLPLMMVVLGAAATGRQSGPSGIFPGFPEVMHPAGNPTTPEKVFLGQALFFEEQVSADNTVACATCHLPEAGGAEARRALRHPGLDGIQGGADDLFGSPGVVRQDASGHFRLDGLFGATSQGTGRNSPSVINAAFYRRLFWNGRAGEVFRTEEGAVVLASHAALESQAVEPPLSHVEMGHIGASWGAITAKLANAVPLALASELPPALADFLAGATTYGPLFERAFGDAAITRERFGMAIACYERTLVSDQTPFDLGTLTPAQKRGRDLAQNPPLCGFCHGGPLFTDGRLQNIHLPGHFRRVKTPSLRNVGLRRRYMHSGQFTTLDQVVDHYESINLVHFTAQEQADLVDFLANGLTDRRVEEAIGPFARPTLRSERVPAGSNHLDSDPSDGVGTLTLLAHVPPLVGAPGFRVGLAGAPSSTPVLLGLSEPRRGPPLAVGPVEIHLDLTTARFSFLETDPDGLATWVSPVPWDPALIGSIFVAQWMIAEAPVAASPAAWLLCEGR